MRGMRAGGRARRCKALNKDDKRAAGAGGAGPKRTIASIEAEG
jgi:hypothetical protein